MTAYKIHDLSGRQVIRCTDCGYWVDLDEGGAIRHSKICDHYGDRTVHPAGRVAQPEATVDVPITAGRDRRLQRAGDLLSRHGTTKGFRSEDEIVEATEKGLISWNDAMNRDD